MTIRASEGETTWVVLNHVKANHWEKHKEFVFNVLIPAAERAIPAEMQHTRFLYAAEPEKDGTYTSVWLMDPVIEDGNYNILKILQVVHGEAEAQKLFKVWADSLVRDQEVYGVIQSKW